MMEFTVSRVVLMSCGVALLAIAAGAAGGAEDRVTDDLDREATYSPVLTTCSPCTITP